MLKSRLYIIFFFLTILFVKCNCSKLFKKKGFENVTITWFTKIHDLTNSRETWNQSNKKECKWICWSGTKYHFKGVESTKNTVNVRHQPRLGCLPTTVCVDASYANWTSKQNKQCYWAAVSFRNKQTRCQAKQSKIGFNKVVSMNICQRHAYCWAPGTIRSEEVDLLNMEIELNVTGAKCFLKTNIDPV